MASTEKKSLTAELYNPSGEGSFVYIHSGRFKQKTGNHSLEKDLDYITGPYATKFQNEKTQSVLWNYQQAMQDSLKLIQNNLTDNEIGQQIIDPLQFKQLMDDAASAIEKQISTQLPKLSGQLYEAHKAYSKGSADKDVQDNNLRQLVKSLSELIQKSNALKGKAGVRGLVNALTLNNKATAESQVQQLIQKETLTDAQRTTAVYKQAEQAVKSYLQIAMRGGSSRSLGSALGNLVGTVLGEQDVLRSLQIMAKKTVKNAAKNIFKTGSYTPDDAFGGSGKPDVIGKNMSITFSSTTLNGEKDNYTLSGSIGFSVKTYNQLGAEADKGIIQIQHSNSLIKRLMDAGMLEGSASEKHAIYNTLAFSQTVNNDIEAAIKQKAGRGYRVITTKLLSKKMLEYLAGTGGKFVNADEFLHNFAPFIIINGRVYSTYSILLKAQDQINRIVSQGKWSTNTSTNSIIYMSASRINNQWVGDDPNATDAKTRSLSTIAAVNTIKMQVKFNLGLYAQQCGVQPVI